MDHLPIITSTQKPWPDFPALTLEDYDAAQLPRIVEPEDDTRYRLSQKDFDDYPFFWLEDARLHMGHGNYLDWKDHIIDSTEKLKLKLKFGSRKQEQCRSIDESRLWSTVKGVYDFSNYPDLEAAIFVQNKYYFGAINELLAFDQPIPTSEFVLERSDGDWVLCTTKLDDYISRWASHLNSLSEGERSQILDRAASFLEHMLKKRWHKDRHLLLRVSASVHILARTIQAAIIWYWDIPPAATIRLSEQSKCLEIAGWCKSAAPKSWQYFNILNAYFASGIDSHLGRHYNHSKCSGKICEAFDIADESKYQTKHTPECDGTCGDIEIDSQSLHDLIMQGKIPLVSLSMGTDGKLNTEVTHTGDVPHYIAISHVWSDGLGNPSANALPYCELLRIFRMLEEWPTKHAKADLMRGFLNPMDMIHSRMESDGFDPLIPQQVKEMREGIESLAEEKINNWLDNLKTSGQYQKVNLWMDTICIPLIPESRKIAITQINDVYSGSFYTVALDAALESLPDTASNEEISVRLALSAWQGRCWTLLERERSTYHLLLRVGNRLVDIVETFKIDELQGLQQSRAFDIAEVRCIINWFKLSGISQKGFRGLDPTKLFTEDVKTDKLLDLHGDFMRIAYSDLMKESRSRWTDELYGQYGESFSLLKCIKGQIARKFHKTYMSFVDDQMTLTNTWNDLAARSTTRASDRIIVFVSSLDIASNTGALREIVQLKHEDRMEAWIRKQSIIPADFLFMNSPRLLTPGLRWAPNDVYPREIRSEVTPRSSDELEFRITRPGMLVTLDMDLLLEVTLPMPVIEEKDSPPINLMHVTDGKTKYSIKRQLALGQPSKPALKFAKGEKIGFIFKHNMVDQGDITVAAVVHVHSDSPDEIRGTFHDIVDINYDSELQPHDLRVDPTKRSRLGRYLGGRSTTNEELNCFWNFELVEKQWVVG